MLSSTFLTCTPLTYIFFEAMEDGLSEKSEWINRSLQFVA
jgi:ABC-type sulfate transport system permease subunit